MPNSKMHRHYHLAKVVNVQEMNRVLSKGEAIANSARSDFIFSVMYMYLYTAGQKPYLSDARTRRST